MAAVAANQNYIAYPPRKATYRAVRNMVTEK